MNVESELSEIPVEFITQFLSERGQVEWNLAVSKAENVLLRQELEGHQNGDSETVAQDQSS